MIDFGQSFSSRLSNLITLIGGGRIAQVYAIRQAVARGLVAYYQKYVDEQSKQEIKVCSRQRPRLEGGSLRLSSQWDKVTRFKKTFPDTCRRFSDSFIGENRPY